MENGHYRVAPPGFTPAQWEEFMREGILIFEDALSAAEVDEYLAAVERVTTSHPNYRPGEYLGVQNFVELDPVLASLIDHPRHVGYVYDVYGEQLKLQLSELFLRTPGGKHNKWHPDGARTLPYGVFSPELPLQIKVGYWLTDLPHAKMGNFVYMPGSHRQQYFDAYDTHDSVSGERILCVPKGAMTIMHGSIWHRVEANESTVTRKNLFLAYCPSWLTAADRLTSDPTWLATLNREQRIIMRSYSHAYDHAKPPAADFPLFLDRETHLDHDPGRYPDYVSAARRKRRTTIEKFNENELVQV
ncbi:MAG: phytanoyl-CoA dioxygenase family protein [Caldilineaceae bacterium]